MDEPFKLAALQLFCWSDGQSNSIAFVDVFKDEQHALSADVSHEQFMYQLILQKRVEESFPNVEIALRIYLVLMVSNCSAERSF